MAIGQNESGGLDSGHDIRDDLRRLRRIPELPNSVRKDYALSMNISVSIVEDDAQVRASLAKLIDGSPGYRCVSQHASAEDALQEIPKFKPGRDA